MPSVPCTLALGLLLAAPLTAQQEGHAWSLSLSLARDVFAGASADTLTIPGVSVEVSPSPRLAFEAGLARRSGLWRLELSAGYAAGPLRAKSDDFLLDDRRGDVKRYRGALTLRRRLATLGAGELALSAGPTLDHWDSPGIGSRTVAGGRGGVVLAFSLGGVVWENRVTYAVSGSPFQKRDLPQGATVSALRTVGVGVALRFGL